MLDRTTTRWRALGAVMVVLVTLTWPTVASATPWRLTLVHQSAVVVLNSQGHGSVHFILQTGGVTGDEQSIDISLYRPITTRTGLDAVINGDGPSGQPLSSTGTFPLNCRTNGVASFTVSLGTGAGFAKTTCGGAQPYLSLNCHRLSCDAVYPLALRTTNAGRSATVWTLLSVTQRGEHNPLVLSWVFETNPGTARSTDAETQALNGLAKYPNASLTVAADYQGVARVANDSSARSLAYRSAMVRALASSVHDLANSPPSSVDFAALARHGLLADAANQLHLGTNLVNRFTNKNPVGAVVLAGQISPEDVRALGTAGVRQIVVPDGSLLLAPSSTLQWGDPFYLGNGSGKVVALSTDSPLRHLTSDSRLSPGLRTALIVGTLALLHYQAPFASAPRVAIVDSPLRELSRSMIEDLLGALRHDPMVQLSGLGNYIVPGLVGANGFPYIRALISASAPLWSGSNVKVVAQFDADLRSFGNSISSVNPLVPLEVDRLIAERRVSPGDRTQLMGVARGALNHQLSSFTIDNTTITLTGTGTPLPITLTSSADFTVHGYLILSAPNVTFPGGSVIPISLSSSTKAIRVPATIVGSGNITLVVQFVTTDHRLILAKGAIDVRSTATSFLGIVLSFGSLAVIGLWWWRTTRRTGRGLHAA